MPILTRASRSVAYALNTPQFSWVKSRLPRKAQPVPPIYQPEVAARAIVWAADHHPRELYVGGPTVEAIVGDKIAPGLFDHYLARTGFDSQQTDGAADPNRPDDLRGPVDADTDHGTHGGFDSRATDRSYQLCAATHRGWMAIAGLGLTGLALAALGGRDR